MDPFECLAALQEDLDNGSIDDATFRARDIEYWISTGGFTTQSFRDVFQTLNAQLKEMRGE